MTLHLQHADSLVTLCPEIGGTIARFSWRGIDILRPAPETAIREGTVRQMACYPLVPYSNRIGHADLIVAGQRHRLRANAPPEPHALHGFGWQRAWQVLVHEENSAKLQLVHLPDQDWPFACEATQRVRLTDNTLHLSLAVRNTDAQPMPAGLGVHPYFPISAETCLQSSWTGMWRMNEEMLPTDFVAAPPETDFSTSRALGGWKVDNCFTGWSRLAALDYATHRVRLEASEACAQIVCFAPDDGRNFIALEPVTNVNDAFALHARGILATGIRELNPGESLEIAMSITCETETASAR